MLTKERLKLTRLHKWLYDKIEESFLFRNYWKFRKNLAWRLLNVAKDDNQICRVRAVRSLASLKTLTGIKHKMKIQLNKEIK